MHHPHFLIVLQAFKVRLVALKQIVLYPIYSSDDDIFRTLCSIFKSRNIYREEFIQNMITI